MKVAQSTLNMESSHSSQVHDAVQEQLHAWVGEQRRDVEANTGSGTATPSLLASASVSLSDMAQAAMQAAQQSSRASKPSNTEETDTDPETSFLLKLLEAMLGRKIETAKIRKIQSDDSTTQQLQAVASAMSAMQASASPQLASVSSGQPQGWGMQYERHASYDEIERTDFTAQGVINTADGQSLEFNVQITMQREFHYREDTVVRAGDALLKDPLVINFSGTAANLSSAKYLFDIDGNGKQDKISFVGPGSGFLALDINMNGKIDDGKELFGTQSGNGFADLAKHDGDQNGWIDENDGIFEKLRVWAKDKNGKDTLYNLQQLKVGALYLGSLPTEFAAKSSNNQLLGQVRSSGVYLKEDGSAGTLQQVDLAV